MCTKSGRRGSGGLPVGSGRARLPHPFHESLMAVHPVPDGYHTVTPYLIVPGVPALLQFLHSAFGATVTREPILREDGTVMHAEVQIGNSRVMMGEPTPEFPAMPVSIFMYVHEPDVLYAQALAAGAESVMPVTTQPHGDRYGGVRDRSGNMWWIAARVEEVSEAELERRMAALRAAADG